MSRSQGRDIEIPTTLLEQIKSGDAMLFLGAGANAGATHPQDHKIPLSGEALTDFLREKFFDNGLAGRSLFDVAKFAESEYGLPRLQEAIAEKFGEYGPANYHCIIAQYQWHAIASTNYDTIIEQAYKRSGGPFNLVPFYKDGDGIDRKLKNQANAVPFLKLHGCITKISDESIPLILTPDQYLRFRKNRGRLYDALKGWAQDFCVLFAGYSIGDPHVAQIIMDLEDSQISRMRYYSIAPDATEYDVRYWGDRRVEILKCTFQEFLEMLDSQVDKTAAALTAVLPRQDHSISRFFTSTETHISDRLSFFLEMDVEHIVPNMKTAGKIDAKAFYEGQDIGWMAIQAELDVHRRVSDDVLAENIITEIEAEAKGDAQLVVIKGPAGNGKSIALRRIAWDASIDYEKLILFVRETGAIDPIAIQEIAERTNRRIFLFVDHCALHHEEILEVYRRAKREGHSVTIVAAERDHEWHTYCGSLDDLSYKEHSVRYLSEREIHSLLGKLEKHNCLGVLLDRPYEERFRAFNEHAGRQLLVALHELTGGKSFEEIVTDDYNRILPIEARYLYLDVCSLNRFNVPVRAGTISRLSNISFVDFSDRLFKPLSNVVRTYYDARMNDNVYTARHPHVAQIVFDCVLDTAEKKFDQMIRILGGMNLDFSTDYIAFREIIRSAGIIDSFPSLELAHRFYDRAIEVTGEQSEYVYQQAAIFELNHAGGTLGRASQLLKTAMELAPHDLSIQHTFANLRRRQALEARTELEAITYRREARQILERLKKRKKSQVYEFHTLAQIDLDELKEALAKHPGEESGAETADRHIGDLAAAADNSLQSGLQRFPNSNRLYALEAIFRTMLSESKRAEAALLRAFELNVRQEFIAVRLSKHLKKTARADEAMLILTRCIDANPSAKFAHLEVATLLLEGGSYDREKVIGHLRRSSTSGDTNYVAQYLLASQYMLDGDEEGAAILFERLSNAPLSNNEKTRIRDPWNDESGTPKLFSGTVESMKGNFCFITTPNLKRSIFSHYSESDPANWQELRANANVSFRIGFSMRGLVALELKLVE